MRKWLARSRIWLWLVPVLLLIAAVGSSWWGFLEWKDSAVIALTAAAAFFAWFGAYHQTARPNLSVHLSATESVSGEVLQVPVRNGQATIDPIVRNSGDRVAERYHVRLLFPSELEPRVRWQLYRPPGGLIRERAPSFRVEEDRPGVLAGWFDTPVFPNLSVQLDRIYLKPVPGEHQVHYGVAHEHGVWEGRTVIRFEENRQER